MLLLNMKSRNAVKLAIKLAKCCFIMLHSSVFEKVRELVGEIKYAFDAIDCKTYSHVGKRYMYFLFTLMSVLNNALLHKQQGLYSFNDILY